MFDNMPAWVKIALAVVLVLSVLAILGPVINFLVNLVLGLVLVVLVLGAGYIGWQKLK